MSQLGHVRKTHAFGNGVFVVILNFRKKQLNADDSAIRLALAGQKAYDNGRYVEP